MQNEMQKRSGWRLFFNDLIFEGLFAVLACAILNLVVSVTTWGWRVHRVGTVFIVAVLFVIFTYGAYIAARSFLYWREKIRVSKRGERTHCASATATEEESNERYESDGRSECEKNDDVTRCPPWKKNWFAMFTFVMTIGAALWLLYLLCSGLWNVRF